MTLDNKILDVLACPVCKGKLKYHRQEHELVCKFDKLAYPIHDDVPILIEKRAKKIQR